MLSIKIITLAIVCALMALPALLVDAIADGWRYITGGNP